MTTGSGKLIDKLIAKAIANGDANKELTDDTALDPDGTRYFVLGDQDPVADDGVIESRLAAPTDLERDRVTRALAPYLASHDLGTLVDVARRFGSGVSSYAALRYYALTSNHTILEVKEERDGLVLHGVPQLQAAEWNSPSARVVNAQQRLQLRPDADVLLAGEDVYPLAFRVHDETSYQRGVDSTDLGALYADPTKRDQLSDLAEVFGRLLARAHGVALTKDGVPGWTVIAPLVGDGAAFGDELAQFAEADAEQIVADWQSLRHQDLGSLIIPRTTLDGSVAVIAKLALASVFGCLLAPAIAWAQPADEPPTQEPAADPAPADPAPPAPLPAVTPAQPEIVPSPVGIEDQPAMPRWADPAHHKLEVDLEFFGTGAYTTGEGMDFSEFRLDRGELGGVVGLGPYFGAELRLESVRSAAEGGALGIDGDSIVIRVKRAQAFGDFDREACIFTVALAWCPTRGSWRSRPDYPMRPLSATASERVLGWPTSDLGGLGRVAYGPVRVSVAFGNGEGLDYPERNDGKTTTGVIEALPLDLSAARVRVMGVARDGSVGPARVRDRRFGGAATLWTPMISAGGELVQAYGIGDRGDLEALALAGWAEARPHPLLALDGRVTTIGYADGGGRATSIGGAVAIEPWRENKNRVHGHSRETDGVLRVWLALDRTTTSGAAMPIAGALAGDATTLLLIVSTTAPYTVD